MNAREITKGVSWLGAVDWNRRLFDSLIPLPDGTSYNAYLVEGSEKTALLDTVDPPMLDRLMAQLKGVESIDYIVSHHAEQDHSGSIGAVLEKFPRAKVVVTPKAKGMLQDHLGIEEGALVTVEDGETLSLGDKTLKFIYTPWVHWPETMVSYLEEDKILFSCDFFGSHIASSDLYVTDECRVLESAKRYFAEIMMPFRKVISKNLDKLEPYEIDIIAPSHGQVFDKPELIIDAWKEWVRGKPKNLVVLPYVSMHGSTTEMVNHLVAALADNGVRVEPFDLTVTDTGKLAIALVDAGTIIVGTPTVLGGPHPVAAYGAFLANALRPPAKFASIIGSFGWGGKTVEALADMLSNLRVTLIDPVMCKGMPDEKTLADLDALAKTIADNHKEQGFE